MSELFGGKPKVVQPPPPPDVESVSEDAGKLEQLLSRGRRSRGLRGTRGTILSGRSENKSLLGE